MIAAAVFASGSGSNAEAIVQASDLPCSIAVLVCDKPEAPVILKAKHWNVETFVCDPKTFPDKQTYEQAILAKLKEKQIEWIFLAGYMRLIGPTLLEAFPGRIVNIHPSLLPAFAGKDAIGQALAAGVKVSGVTIHYVDAGMDTGTIIAQEAVQVQDTDTRQTLHRRIQAIEHRLYPETIRSILT
ncbi:phosphoribosylglycinamide formyltransferase [Terribacillus sp. 7520-G]|uniref:phosphoribosylglycinamide formyltransferase n=1 Tax=Terribacillus TaxID=459532 RepID=UPI000BA5D8B4|nr:phosphoribosylglycinamide formyltransferase [Terribacillus sp. 7520-G]PAD39561.1 phosphoribosylglycinamide formyltransferase [Terribacillus sp. 7520-G]